MGCKKNLTLLTIFNSVFRCYKFFTTLIIFRFKLFVIIAINSIY